MNTAWMLVVLLTAFAASQPSGAETQDWPAFHGGGALVGEATPIDVPPPMRVRWTYRTDDAEPVGVLGSAAIVGAAVYVADENGTLHAINLANGEKLWTYTANAGF